jgi:GTP-binding protein Era
VDTPGVFLGKKDPVSKRLNEYVKGTLKGVDAIVYVVDPTRVPGQEEARIQSMLRETSIPIVIALNKSDLLERERPFVDRYRELELGQLDVLEISASRSHNLNRLVDVIFETLPEGEAYYPAGQLTDIEHKEWVEEIIREKVFLSMSEEIPYSTTVRVEDMATRSDGTRLISANIITSEERHKGMIVGAGGKKIKEIGIQVRKELETVLQAKIYLELRVKVDPQWQYRFR